MLETRGGADNGHKPGLQLGWLGPLEASYDGLPLRLGGARQRSVLACLLAEPSHQLSSDRLVDAIWGDQPPADVTLQTYVFRLRQALEPGREKGRPPSVLVTTAGGYRLDVLPGAVDASTFEDLVRRGQRLVQPDPQQAADLLTTALSLWRGAVLSDLPDLDFVAPAATRLEELRLGATESCAQARLALGEHDAALAILDPLVTEHPLREHAAALRMLALYRAGRQSDALAGYRQLRRTLDDELGVSPSQELESLHEGILRHDPGLEPPQPQTAPLQAVVPNSPAPAPATGRAVAPDPVTQAPAGTPNAQRLRRRRWVAIGAVVALAAGALVGTTVVLANRQLSPLPANSAGPLQGGLVTGDAVGLPSAPVSMVSAGGAVWAVLANEDALVRIDPRTRQVTQTVAKVGGNPQAVAAGGDDLWVAGYDEKVVTRVNVSTAQVVDKIPVGIAPAAVATDATGVWVANSGDNTVQHVDAATGKVGRAITVGDGPDALALDGTTLWVANGRAGTLTPIDTRTGQPAAADVRVDAGPTAIAVTDTDLWVANEFGQSVSRIAKDTGRVTPINVKDGPVAVQVDADSKTVWVALRYAGSLTAIDIATNAARDEPVAGAPSALTTHDGDLWAGAGAYTSPEHKGGTTVWEDVVSDLGAVDPSSGGPPEYVNLQRVVYDTLVVHPMAGGRASQALVPDLATRIPEPSDGGRTYVFAIREGIPYSTGAVVLASDFVRGAQRAMVSTAGNPAFYAAIIGAAQCGSSDDARLCDLSKGVVADDANHRLTIHLSRPDPELLEKLAYFVVPMPAGTPTKVPTRTLIPGTGPYQIASATADGSVSVVRNARFHQWSFAAQPDGYPDRIDYRVVATKEQAAADVLAGRAQAAYVNGAVPASVAQKPQFVRGSYNQVDIQYLFPNTRVAPFDDVRVRQAFSYAFDRRVIARVDGSTPTCQTIPATLPGYRPYCPYQSGPATGPYQGPDVAKAQALVAASGTRGMPVTMAYRDLPLYARMATYGASVLRELGYRVTMRPFQPDEDRSRLQVTVPLGWVADYPSPADFYYYETSCAQPNSARYCNRAIEAKAGHALSLTRSDPAASLEEWAAVDRMLVDDAAVMPVLSSVGTVLASPTLGNVVLQPGAGPLLDQVWVK